MYVKRHSFLKDFSSGTFTNASINTTTYASPTNHPAIVPNVVITAGTTTTGKQLIDGGGTVTGTLNTGNAWSLVDTILATAQAGDSISFITSSSHVTLAFTGLLTAGMVQAGGAGVVAGAIRNGGLVQVLVGNSDGTNMVVQASADLGNAAPTVTLALDGLAHTVEVLFPGAYGNRVKPFGPVQATTGVSVAGNLSLSPSTSQRSLIPATWSVVATGTTTYTLWKTPPGGSQVQVGGTYNTGTAYDSASIIPGAVLQVNGPLSSGDAASFTTDVVMAALMSVLLQDQAGGVGGGYTSDVIDSMDPAIDVAGICSEDTQWFAAKLATSDWFQGKTNGVGGYLAPVVAISVGNTPVPDESWLTVNARLVDSVNPRSGARTGTLVAGFPATLRGRYAQWSVVFPEGLIDTPYFRDVRLYYWVPERDPSILNQLVPFGVPWTVGPNLAGFTGTLGVIAEDTRQRVLDFISSYAISGAVDSYLQQIGADYGLGTYLFSLIPPETFRAICQAIKGSRPNGGSPTFLAQQVARVVGGDPDITLITSTLNSLQTVQANSPALTTGPVVVSQTGAWVGEVTIPPPAGIGVSTGYPGLPGIPQTIAVDILTTLVNALRPLGVSLDIVYL